MKTCHTPRFAGMLLATLPLMAQPQDAAKCRSAVAAERNAALTQNTNDRIQAGTDLRNKQLDCDKDKACNTAAYETYRLRIVKLDQQANTIKGQASQKANNCVLQPMTPQLDTSGQPLTGGVETKVPTTPPPTTPRVDGQRLPALVGQTSVNGHAISVSLAAGHFVGQGTAGAVLAPDGKPSQWFSTAQGFIVAPGQFQITQLYDRNNREVRLAAPVTVSMSRR